MKNEKYVQLYIKTNLGESYEFNYLGRYNKYKYRHDEINRSCYYYRNDNNEIDKKESINYNNNDVTLFRIRKSLKDGNKYEIINPVLRFMKKNGININQLNNVAWYVINSEKNDENYILNENDIIKLGRKKYEIIKININNNNIKKENYMENDISKINKKIGSIFNINIEPYQYSINNYNSFDEYIQDKSSNQNVNNPKYNILKKINKSEITTKSFSNNGIENDNKNDNSMIRDIYNFKSAFDIKENNDDDDNINSLVLSNDNEKCRICSRFKSTKENPKLRICECKDYVHYECLKNKMKEKIDICENSDKRVKTYICSQFNCNVCLTPYPSRFIIKEYNRKYELIDYNIASELDYLVLESLDYIKEGMNFKLIHVVQLTKDKISIGRQTKNDIIDPDISVSRNHAILNYNKEKGYITIENRSQFGTLVLIKGNIIIKEKKVGFQVGNSYITAYMSENHTDSSIPTDYNEPISQMSTVNNSKKMNH